MAAGLFMLAVVALGALFESCKAVSDSDNLCVQLADGVLSRDSDFSVGTPLFYGLKKGETTIHTSSYLNHLDKDTSDDFNLAVYPVIIDEKILRGWLRVQYKVKGKFNEFLHIVINAEDENFMAVGEFTDEPVKYCTPATLISSKQLLPCLATPANEPIHPGAFIYVSPNYYTIPAETIPAESENLKGEINIYWKFSQFYCNQKKKIRFRSHVLTKARDALKKGLYTKTFWIKIRPNFRASDPFPVEMLKGQAKVSCSPENMFHRSKQLWYVLDNPIKYNTDDFNIKRCGKGKAGESYVGRCSNEIIRTEAQQVSAMTQDLICSQRGNKNSPKHYHYDTYVAERFNSLGLIKTQDNCCPTLEAKKAEINQLIVAPCDGKPVSDTCMPPTTTTTTTTTTTKTTKKPTKKGQKGKGKVCVSDDQESIENKVRRVGYQFCSDEKKNSTVQSTVERIWNNRKWHGIFMTIATLFVIPVNFFVTRYFKETFMKKRTNYCLPWFFIHIISVPFVAILFTFGTYILGSSQLLGFSFHAAAKSHRGFGWFGIVLFWLLAILGGFRVYSDRLVCVTTGLHWGFGVFLYLCLLIIMCGSTSIPGSPSATFDIASFSILDAEKAGPFNQLLIFCIIFWILIEIMFHVLMSINLIRSDKSIGAKRIYTPVALPIMHDFAGVDLPGGKFRKFALGLYILLVVVITVAVCAIILSSDVQGRGLGPMSCTHDALGNFLSASKYDPACWHV